MKHIKCMSVAICKIEVTQFDLNVLILLNFFLEKMAHLVVYEMPI